LIAAERGQNRIDISPDGKFAAYGSNETGNLEIYSTTFPSGEGKMTGIDRGGDLRARVAPASRD
jgi:Tol biopolymer transport system component